MQGNLAQVKSDILAELKMRVEDRILEPNNYEVLCKLINKADSISEAQAIAALGTTYKKTGFHFDTRLENLSNDIHFLAKDKALSFENDENAITHKLIIGDNYPALLNLLITYREKIKVIYIDPPYGKDDLGEFAKTNYENAITRDNLLSMLKPRLQIAKMLLKDDGVIFCSIDDRNQAYVKCLFDDIFGEGNFVANIVWNSISSVLKQSKFIRKEHEYILCYAKNKDNLEFNKLENTMEFSNPDNDPKGEWFSSNAAAPNQNNDMNKFAIKLPNSTECVRNWKFSFEDFTSGKVSLYFKNGNVPRLKIYKNEYDENTKILASIFKDLGSITTAKAEMKCIFSDFEYDLFDTPKPLDLIKQILQISTLNDDIILDFFAGSGTTAHAVMELNRADNGNRECILVTNNEITELNPNGIAVDVTAKRLKRIMSGECYDGSKNFKWREKNEPYKDNLEVFRIEKVSKYAQESNKSVLEVIDESAYGLIKFDSIHEKAKWIAKNFDITLKELENDKAYKMRQKGE